MLQNINSERQAEIVDLIFFIINLIKCITI